MCGRYTLSAAELLAEILDEIEDRDMLLRPRYNVAPQTQIPVILDTAPRRLTAAKWGLVPFWAKEPKVPYSTINAKAETVATAPAYREAFKRRHCLIPADGVIEWQKPDATTKIPHRITRDDGAIFYFAGLWEEWRAKDQPEDVPPLRTCTIITTTPNPTFAPIHNRMPVVLSREDEQRWLDPKLTKEERQVLLTPYAGPMRAYRIQQRIGAVKNQDAGVLDPA